MVRLNQIGLSLGKELGPLLAVAGRKSKKLFMMVVFYNAID
jgi:hypothetical protein